MSLIVEDGSGLATAESYVSLAEADLYFSNIGNTAWALLTNSLKEQAIRRAMAYMTSTYRQRWQGYRRWPNQGQDWPRWNVFVHDLGYGAFVDPNSTPKLIKDATCDLAVYASVEDLQAPLTQGVLKETVGPISVEYDPNSSRTKSYAAVDAKLAIYTASGSGGSQRRLIRC